jgi:glycosyltransferase involved in cell wall biosynthesis
LFLQDAIDGVKHQTIDSWELIIIEDHSSDNTYDIAKRASHDDNRIYVYKNIGQGKVEGLNLGYSLCNGSIIKCIDSDDVLHHKFIEYCLPEQFDAMCHDAFVTSANLDVIGCNTVNNKFLKNDLEYCLKAFSGLARWNWSVTREIAEYIFPIPHELPFEDLWFMLRIKRYCKRVVHISVPLYYYRQHDQQTYGGILSYNEAEVIFRAKRKLKYIEYLLNNYYLVWSSKDELEHNLAGTKQYYLFMAEEKLRLFRIVFSGLLLKQKVKLLALRKAPGITTYLKNIVIRFNMLRLGGTRDKMQAWSAQGLDKIEIGKDLKK